MFRILMIGGMVSIMVTVNGLRSTGFGFMAYSHWLYPLVFCIAFLLRSFVCNRAADAFAARLIAGRLSGARLGISMTVLNVLCTAPVLCAIVTLLITGSDDFLLQYATSLPLSIPIAIVVNYFVVGPVVKLLYANVLCPSRGMGVLYNLEQQAHNFAFLFGN